MTKEPWRETQETGGIREQKIMEFEEWRFDEVVGHMGGSVALWTITLFRAQAP